MICLQQSCDKAEGRRHQFRQFSLPFKENDRSTVRGETMSSCNAFASRPESVHSGKEIASLSGTSLPNGWCASSSGTWSSRLDRRLHKVGHSCCRVCPLCLYPSQTGSGTVHGFSCRCKKLEEKGSRGSTTLHAQPPDFADPTPVSGSEPSPEPRQS